MKNAKFRTVGLVLCNAIGAAGVLIGVAGCSDAPPSDQSMKSRQDAALSDPFGYGPKLPTTEPQKRDNSLKGDWDRFWNP